MIPYINRDMYNFQIRSLLIELRSVLIYCIFLLNIYTAVYSREYTNIWRLRVIMTRDCRKLEKSYPNIYYLLICP